MYRNRDTDSDSEEPAVHFLSDRMSLSLKLVVSVVVFAVWLMRLSDKVDTQEKEIKRLQQCIQKAGCGVVYGPED